MNEKNKLYIVLGIVVVIFLVLVMFVAGESKKGDKILQEVKNKINSENGGLIYIMSKECSYCTMYDKEIKKVKAINDFEHIKVDITDLTKAQFNELLTIVKFSGDINSFGTPYMTYMKNSEAVKVFPSYHPAKELFGYLKEINLIPSDKMFLSEAGDQLVKKVKEGLNNENGSLIYITNPISSEAAVYQDEIEHVKRNSNFEYLTIDTNDLTDEQLDEILDLLKVQDKSKFKAPYMTYVKNNKVVREFPSYNSANELLKQFKEISLVSSSAEMALNFINYNEYTNLLNSKENEVIVIGRTGCSWCSKVIPILEKISLENKIKINYFNFRTINNEIDYNSFTKSLSYFDKDWGTPVMLIVKDGKLIDVLENYNDQYKYVEFLKKNEIIKG